MKTSVSRKMDELGRIIIPKPVREILHLKSGELVDIIEENEKIIIRKSICKCIYCGEIENLHKFTNHMICNNCIRKIAEMVKNQ